MREPVLILSDLHLGHGGSVLTDVSMLEPMLEGAATLLLNGDTWQELTPQFRDRALELRADLQAMCHRRGVDLIMMPGNHDPGESGPRYVELAQGRVVVMHGDGVFIEGAPWNRMALRRHRELWQLIRSHVLDTVEQRLELVNRVAYILVTPHHNRSRRLWTKVLDAIYPPQRALYMLIAWWTMVTETARMASDYFPRAEVVIFGHFHRAGSWLVGNRVILNSGSFMPPGKAMWAWWDGKRLGWGECLRCGEQYERGATLESWHWRE